jgi:hypothetical protein
MCPANSRPIARARTGNLQDYEDCVLAAQESWQVYRGSERDNILKDLHVSGEQSAHSAGEDRQPAGLRGLCSRRTGILAGIV